MRGVYAVAIFHWSPVTDHQSPFSKRQRSTIRFKLGKWHHVNGVPRAAFQKRAVGAFAGAKFATDAEQGIDDNAAKGRLVFGRSPKHAIRDRGILDASR